MGDVESMIARRCGFPVLSEDGFERHGLRWALSGGVLRATLETSEDQSHTAERFGYKWGRRDSFESEVVVTKSRLWLTERYGSPAILTQAANGGARPLILDAGCGAAYSIMAWAGDVLAELDYVGVDTSEAVDMARLRFMEQGLSGLFLQADLMRLPFAEGAFDAILSEGVLHHTDDSRAGLCALVRLLRPGGRLLFYVYRRKGPVREFTDDHIRQRLDGLSPAEGWAAMMPLTHLGKVLGDLDLTIDVPEAVDLLEIPAGPISLQRLFYWHVFKAFYDPDMSLEEMNHINFDWYAPRNARRHSEEEVREWCAEAGLRIDREVVEPAGITMVCTRL